MASPSEWGQHMLDQSPATKYVLTSLERRVGKGQYAPARI